jgi:cell division protein FtsZ
VVEYVPGQEELEEFGPPKILVVGCGGGGCNTVDRLMKMGLKGAETLAVNTDAQHLGLIEADKKVLIGSKLTRGLGAGGDPEVGKLAAENALSTLQEILQGADMVFVTAGMGGGTGTGAAPVIASLAKEQGSIVVALVTTPFHIEKARVLAAEAGLEVLRKAVDTLIVMDNNRLLEVAPYLPLDRALSVVDQLISEIIKGIAETLTEPSLINLDYADVRTIMRCGGPSFMVVGEGSLKDGAERIVQYSLSTPLLDVDYRGAKGCLLHITGGCDLTLKEAAAIAGTLTKELDPRANVIWGSRIRRGFEGKVRVMAIITGVRSAQVMAPDTVVQAEVPASIDVIPRSR